MTNITYPDVLERQAQVPWPHLHQVEQDLMRLSRDGGHFQRKFLRGQGAMGPPSNLGRILLPELVQLLQRQ